MKVICNSSGPECSHCPCGQPHEFTRHCGVNMCEEVGVQVECIPYNDPPARKQFEYASKLADRLDIGKTLRVYGKEGWQLVGILPVEISIELFFMREIIQK